MNKQICLVVLGAFLLNAVGCTTHRAFVQYDEFKHDMNVQAGPISGESLGGVSGEDGGAIWNNCNDKAKGSVREMISNAKAMGANAVGDLKWAATNGTEPACKKGWGYLVIWPFVLTPLFMSTKVSGTAYKTKGGRAGLYMIPESLALREALVERIVTQTL